MEHNFQHLDSNKLRPRSTHNRKRVRTTGRQSPRALFGNFKLKKSFIEDDTISRDLNNSKTSCGWKPPLKADFNNSNNDSCSTFSGNHSDSFNKSSQNEVAVSPSIHTFDIDEKNYCGPNATLGFKEQYILGGNGESDEESFTGNFGETVSYREYTDQNDKQNVQNLNFQDDSQSHNLSFDNSMNDDNLENFEKIKDIEDNKINFEHVNENENSMIQLLVEKQDLIDTDKDCLITNFHNDNLQNIHDSMNNHSQDTRIQRNESFQEYIGKNEYHQFEENELSENSDSSTNTVELNVDLKNFLVMEQGNAINNNGLQYETKHDYSKEKIDERRKEAFECQASKKEEDTEDSFCSGVTNSEFLQFESQVTKSSRSMDMKISCNTELNNSIDTIKKFTSSLTTQNEWQKNILKSIMKDINELNKAVVNATASIKSLRRDDAPAK